MVRTLKAIVLCLPVASVLSCAAMLGAETVLETWYASRRGAHPDTVRIEGRKIRIDLKDLPANAKVHSARLAVFREPIDGTMDEALERVEILANSDGSWKPLSLLPPWYDRFDATAAVRAALEATSRRLTVVVKTFPKWQPDRTCLEITYEGRAKGSPPPVRGLKVMHRAGQTFVTWQEIDRRVAKESVTWGDLNRLLDEADQARAIRYRIYRHTAPITATTIAQAEFLGEVGPLSAYNVRGRSVDQLMAIVRRRAIDDLELAKRLAREDYFTKYGPDMPEMDEVVVNRFAIEVGRALPIGAGLYVHHPQRAEKAYYGVAVAVDGVANLAQWTQENATIAAMDETVGAGEPVLQGKPDVVVFFDYPGTRLQYVQWAAPPLAHLPNQYYNWGVFVPRGYEEAKPRRLSIFFHDRHERFLKPAWPHRLDTVLLSPHDAPYRSYGYGYHESLGTLRGFKEGKVEPFFARRVDAVLAWAIKRYHAEPGRVSCGGHGPWGGTAALQYGIKRPGTIAYVLADASPDPDPEKMPYEYSFYGRGDLAKSHRADMDAVWGKSQWNLPGANGKPIWQEVSLPAYVRANGRKITLPYVSLGAGGLHVTWLQETELMKAYLETHNAFMGEFWWGGSPCLALPVSADMGDRPFEPRNDRPLLAVASRDCGPSPKFMAEQFETGKRGYSSGARLNTKHRWEPEDIVDTPERLEMTTFSAAVVYAGGDTCEVVLRNARCFKPAPGEKVAWSLRGLDRSKGESGEVVVGEEGWVILPAVHFGPPARLTLERKAK